MKNKNTFAANEDMLLFAYEVNGIFPWDNICKDEEPQENNSSSSIFSPVPKNHAEKRKATIAVQNRRNALADAVLMNISERERGQLRNHSLSKYEMTHRNRHRIIDFMNIDKVGNPSARRRLDSAKSKAEFVEIA